MDVELKRAFETITAGHSLTREQAREVFGAVMSGALPEATIGALLGALRAKGETVEEIVGAAEAMREKAIPVRCPADGIDTCGTGGDGISTFNASTTAAIVAAAAGVTVAKHGNRSTTRVSGSTEVLEHLGIDTDAPTELVERTLKEVRIGYLNACSLHPAMRYAAAVRQAIPVRTVFNLLGPLTNPAGVTRQLLGVPSADLLDTMAEALCALGATRAWVIHGSDGLCDVTATAVTRVVEVRNGSVHRFELSPEDVGLARTSLDALRVSSSRQSADTVRAVLRGEAGGPRDHTLMNAGAALVVGGVAAGIEDGVRRAAEAIDDGRAAATLEAWRKLAPRTVRESR